jgi:hypothetical protein
MLSFSGAAKSLLPQEDGSRTKFTTTIEMPKGYVSGICVIMLEGDVLKGSIFNEFGITAMDFTYQIQKEKVKLISVLPMLNKWYIKRVLKKDLKAVIKGLEQGKTTYENTRRHILYQFLPLSNAEPEDLKNDSQDNEIAQ